MAWRPDYITPAQLASTARADVIADAEDLADACSAASRTVDTVAGRQFGKTEAPEVRYFEPLWSASKGMWQIITDDFITLTEVAWDSAFDGTYATVLDLTALIKFPQNAPQEGRPYEGFYVRRLSLSRPPSMKVTANPWGWATTPRTAVMATKLQALRYFTRRDAPFGVAGSPNDGSETRLLAKADPDVITMLRSHGLCRRAWAR